MLYILLQYLKTKLKLSSSHFLRSSWMVFCRLAMLASRAARPSWNATSSLVLKVEPDLMLQLDTDSTSHCDMELNHGPLTFGPHVRTPSKPDWLWSGLRRTEVSAGLLLCWDVTRSCNGTFPSLSAAVRTCSVCGGSASLRDLRYWLMRSVEVCGAGSCLWGCCCVTDAELPTASRDNDEHWIWKSLKHQEQTHG